MADDVSLRELAEGDGTAAELLAQLRADGWRVAAHNDYQQGGLLCTFYLFTHEAGVFAKGEAAVSHLHGDRDALRIAALAAAKYGY